MTEWLRKNIWFSLLLFPFTNIVLCVLEGKAAYLDYTWYFIGKQLAICFAVAVAEELFFRGLLLKELVSGYGWKPIAASILTSLIFGIMHLLNVNSYASCGYAIVQSLCAFAVSVNLSAIFVKTRSLLWCIISHALINITSIGLDGSYNVGALALTSMEVSVFLIVSVLYFIQGISLLNEK